MTYKIPYKGEHGWLNDRTILFVRHGSHAYGLNIATSDEDFKGVCIPPKQYTFGFMEKFEQAEGKDPDLVVYDIRKFMKLAADNNPSIIEVLWSDPLIVTPGGERLQEIRDQFLSKKAKHTFSGYAYQQLERIERHYKWIRDPPKSPPTRLEFGLPERTLIPADQIAAANAAIQKKLDEWTVDFLEPLDPDMRIVILNKMTQYLAEIKVAMDTDVWVGAARTIGLNDNMIELLDLERRYTARQKQWTQFQKWKKERNPERAILEEKFGYDVKHAMHLVRLMRMCREILATGKVIVKRPDRDELLAIRNGAWTYEQIVEWARKQDQELEELYKQCTILPHSCDRNTINKICIELFEGMSVR